MNQTAWIVGGGIVVVAFAILLYLVSGTSPSVAPVNTALSLATTSESIKGSAPVTPMKQTTPVVDTTITPSSTPEAKPTIAPTSAGTSVILHTSMGNITIKLYTKNAPKTVENFVKLVNSGFYDGIKFHRVITGFMIQTGDPLTKDNNQINAWGTGGPGYKFSDEIDAQSPLYADGGYHHGIVAMANSGPNTNGSQFFIMAADYPLPPLYTIFGEVTSGLDIVDAIDAVKTDGSAQKGGNDRPLTPVVINSAKVL